MAWTTPAAQDMRFGFEITMYILIVNFLLINKILTKGPVVRAFLFSKRLTQKINKFTIETMMNSALLHKSFISQPECGLMAYWVITRDISNRTLGNYRT